MRGLLSKEQHLKLFHSFAEKKSRLVTFGLTEMGLDAKGLSFINTQNVLANFDNNKSKWGNTICGIKTLPPEQLKQFIDDNEIEHVVIMAGASWRAIAGQLDQYGVSDYLAPLSLVSEIADKIQLTDIKLISLCDKQRLYYYATLSRSGWPEILSGFTDDASYFISCNAGPSSKAPDILKYDLCSVQDYLVGLKEFWRDSVFQDCDLLVRIITASAMKNQPSQEDQYPLHYKQSMASYAWNLGGKELVEEKTEKVITQPSKGKPSAYVYEF